MLVRSVPSLLQGPEEEGVCRVAEKDDRMYATGLLDL